MIYPLLIAGEEIPHHPFVGRSPFYPGYGYEIASAGALEVSSILGALRAAKRLTLPDRCKSLTCAADTFAYTQQDVEHAVRMTGMPIRLVDSLFQQIPKILRGVPMQLSERFHRLGQGSIFDAEVVDRGLVKALVPQEGFCYAITPGNDPRATAIVAANLGYLGIPFVIRASIHDAAAPLVIRALIAGGFDPRTCNLVYLDRNDPQTQEHHFRLVEASTSVWTFGPAHSIDRTLRYRPSKSRATIDVDEAFSAADAEEFNAWLASLNPSELARRVQFETPTQDLFADKQVLRHETGNCAAIVSGPLTTNLKETLYEAIAYPIACTATKSVMVIGGGDWIEETSHFLAGLTAGDPLDLATQVGYIDPGCLDTLERLRQDNALRAHFTGGERLSAYQARPLLVASQEECPDFFAQEIPAYVLGVRACQDLSEAIAQINQNIGMQPRLAVSLLNFTKGQLSSQVLELRAQAILVNLPTTRLLPAFHEGNDYSLLLTKGRFLSF